MRKQRRKDVNLGIIFANVTNRTTKTVRLTDLYKKLGMNFHGSWDYIWTTSPDGKTESFTAVPYKPSHEEYFENIMSEWRNGA